MNNDANKLNFVIYMHHCGFYHNTMTDVSTNCKSSTFCKGAKFGCIIYLQLMGSCEVNFRLISGSHVNSNIAVPLIYGAFFSGFAISY